jgi:hypothetical protein
MADYSSLANLRIKKHTAEHEATSTSSTNTTKPRLQSQCSPSNSTNDIQASTYIGHHAMPIERRPTASTKDMQQSRVDYKRTTSAQSVESAKEAERAYDDMRRRAQLVNERERSYSFGDNTDKGESKEAIDESPETSCDEAEMLLEHGAIHGGGKAKQSKNGTRPTTFITRIPFVPK